MIEKAIVGLFDALGAAGSEERPKAHCRDCGIEINRAAVFCDTCRDRRYMNAIGHQ